MAHTQIIDGGWNLAQVSNKVGQHVYVELCA